MKIRMLLLLFFSSGIFAQQSLTLADAWAIARQNNLALQQQQVQQSQVAAEVRIQQSDYLPKLSVSAGAQYVSEIAKIDVPFLPNPIEAGVKERYDLSANLQQPIFTGFRTSNLVKAAKNQQAAAELQENTVRMLAHLDPSSQPVGQFCQHSAQKISVAIGPEGGFSAKEIAIADAANFRFAKLDNAILRAETAAIVAATQIKSLFLK